jgi:Protein of unknown function (DUF1203)
MRRFRISGIPASLAQEVRSTLRSPQYGHPAHIETATGYGPCRECLRTFHEGQEERILFTYQPFPTPALPAPGPVFIHRSECSRYDELGFPEELRSIPLALESYGAEGEMLERRLCERPIEEELTQQLANGRVEYMHLRNAEAGCFIARVEPVFACD